VEATLLLNKVSYKNCTAYYHCLLKIKVHHTLERRLTQINTLFLYSLLILSFLKVQYIKESVIMDRSVRTHLVCHLSWDSPLSLGQYEYCWNSLANITQSWRGSFSKARSLL